MSMERLGENPWPLRALSEGWHHLRDAAHDAVTHFRHHDDQPNAPTRTDAPANETPETGRRWGLVATDIVDQDGHLEVRMEIPGIDRADLRVEVVGEHLVVSGEKRSESTRKSGRVVVTERAFGQFRRVVPLPSGVDSKGAKARYADGVLSVDLPKSDVRNGETIPIGA